ncbi:MAG: metallophosphoesterase [Clostridia bacterium]|nr:metallophosphoesterase [Clostridia bacterium]
MRISRQKNRAARISAALISLLVLVSLCACDVKDSSEPSIEPGTREKTVFVATDLHLFSNNLISPDNSVYLKDRFTSDGRIQEYDYELIGALIEEVNAKKPEFLILTGDLTFNGELDSHLELSRLLSAVQDTKVLVIPGNHDIYSPDAVSALNDSTQPTESISAEQFRGIYANYGYTNAYSYDETTLSYIFELDEDKWALMLDTSLSRYNESYGGSITAGALEESTLNWLEENLAYAQENGISVISFTHHNLLAHNDLFVASYTLQNSAQLTELYAKYGVSLNFSGHLHIQSIKKATMDEGAVYDVSGGSILDYGNRYGVLDIYDNCYKYTSHKIGKTPSGEDISQYSFDVFCKEYYAKTLWSYQSSLGEDKGAQAVKLLSEINAYYFDGSYKEINKLVKQNRSLIKLIKENTFNYESSYVSSIIEVDDKNQHSLIIERK